MSVLDEAAHEVFAPVGTSRWYRSMRQYWHPVAYSSEVQDAPVGVTLLDEPVVLARLDGEIRAFRDICRHKGAALSLGFVHEHCQLVCPYHGWHYGADGRVKRIPSNPELNGKLDVGVQSYHVCESLGMVWVCLDEQEPRFPVPDFAEWHDPSVHWLVHESYVWETSAPRRLENFVDFAHFPWVHENILGTRDHPEIHEHKVWRDEGVIRFGKEGLEPNAGRKKELLGLEHLPLIDAVNDYHLFMPASIYLHRTFRDNGKRYMLFVASQPVGPKTTKCFWLQGRDFGLGAEGDAYMTEFEAIVLAQDIPFVESQKPEHLPDELSTELYVKTADAVTLNYRLFLHELAREYEAARA